MATRSWPVPLPRFRLLLLLALWLSATLAAARGLPAEVDDALRRAKVPPEAVHVLVQDVGGPSPRLEHQADVAVNPASLVKLVTTQAALEMLGPAWRWRTPVWLHGTIADGVLDGRLVIKGTGDPTLVVERLWLLLRRVQQFGVREIRGDIVLDTSAFAVPNGHPGDFDNEPLRPYNVRPDALLLNHKALTYTFIPDAPHGVARVAVEPPLAGLQVDATVPLTTGACNDWRGALRARFDDPHRVRFDGHFPGDCGERQWMVAHPDPAGFNARLVEAMWRQLGGSLRGSVRPGLAPAAIAPTFEWESPPLADVVRDVNKFSNNVMAQQLFLTLALQATGLGEPQAARTLLQRWLDGRAADAVIDNGSGLSRDSRLSARQLAQVLQRAWAGPLMPELAASLPVAGVDGTMRRSRAQPGRAHLKTGSLRDVVGVAGYVHTVAGQRRVLVAIVNHPNASAAREALDLLVQWTLDAPSALESPR